MIFGTTFSAMMYPIYKPIFRFRPLKLTQSSFTVMTLTLIGLIILLAYAIFELRMKHKDD